MRMKAKALGAIAAAFIAATIFMGVAYGQSRTLTNCEGNACSEVEFRWTGSCYNVTNRGSRVVSIRMGRFSFELAPGDTHTPAIPPYCVTSFEGNPQANYR